MRITGCEETDMVDDDQQGREASPGLQGRVLAVSAHPRCVPRMNEEATESRCYYVPWWALSRCRQHCVDLTDLKFLFKLASELRTLAFASRSSAWVRPISKSDGG
jgi:hypothetical protein